MSHDVVIRNGLIVDGSGAPGVVGDVAIDGRAITAVGDVSDGGALEIDATGRVVTPGFVDIHTHLDAQLWWDPSGSPGTWHGVTSIVMGNCGVTFAPVRAGQAGYLAAMMESVEDIPGAAILDGLPWTWTTYGEFLRTLEQRPLGPNAGGMVGHCAVRHYAMGDAAVGDSEASTAELAEMTALVGEALDAGAVGFSTSRTALHMLPDKRPVPGTFAPQSELRALAAVMAERGRGILGAVTRLHEETGATIDATLAEIDLLGSIALDSGRPVTFNLTQGRVAGLHERILERVHEYRSRGAQLWPQTTIRPIGWLYGIAHRTPWDKSPTWRSLRGLGLEAKLARIAERGTRAALIDEAERSPAAMSLERVYAFPDGPARYDLGPEHSLSAHARRSGVGEAEAFIDIALESAGAQVFTWPIFNDDPAAVETIVADDATILGLADAGAHVGQIMDASQPTYLLASWARDRKKMSLERAVERLTDVPAAVFGLTGRGRLQQGFAADVNVFDYSALSLHHPEYVHDLPGGAGRFVQRADGYEWTFVNGTATLAGGRRTGSLPGIVLR